MAKDDVIELEGIVTDALPNAMFKVKLPNAHKTHKVHITFFLGVSVHNKSPSSIYRAQR